MKFNEIQCNSMKFNEIQWKSMKFKEIQWNSIKVVFFKVLDSKSTIFIDIQSI